MALQTTVNTYAPIGFPGQMVAFGQAVYTPFNFLSDGTVKAGKFAFLKTAPADAQNTYGIAKATGDTLIGFVERVLTPKMDAAYPDTYVEGAELTIAEQGDFYIAATGAATVGQKVLVATATGAIAFGSSAGEGQIDTGFVVKTAAAASGDIIIISRHGNIIPAGADLSSYLTKSEASSTYLTKAQADEYYEPKTP